MGEARARISKIVQAGVAYLVFMALCVLRCEKIAVGYTRSPVNARPVHGLDDVKNPRNAEAFRGFGCVVWMRPARG
jgi:hypothetical protein